jgi:hypothetical protein
MPYGIEGRDWSYRTASQGIPKTATKPSEAKKRKEELIPGEQRKELLHL